MASAVAGVAALVLVPRGNGGPERSPTPSVSASAPFRFTIASTTVNPRAPGKADRTEVRDAIRSVTFTMNRLYQLAFLDPAVWKSGDFSVVFGFFSPDQMAKARRDEATLTLGAGARRTYTQVEPGPGTLRIGIRTNDRGDPTAIVVRAAFTASATRKAGGTTEIRSRATYDLRLAEGGWLIVRYRAARSDREEPPGSG